MVLPLYLAMTAEEMADAQYPAQLVLWDWPGTLCPGTLLVLTDLLPFGGDPAQIAAAVKQANCSGVLLDFEQKPDDAVRMVADALFQALPCPVAAPPGFIDDAGSPVFLPPCPLHTPLAEHLRPWQGRELWLDVTLWQQTIIVTREGTTYAPPTPAVRQDGVFDEILLCRCVTEILEDEVRFTLLDTPETLKRKLETAAGLGVTRAVGLYQELGKIL